MCTRLTLVPAASAGSVNENAARPLLVRSVLIALRSWVTCTALILVCCGTSGSSVKVNGVDDSVYTAVTVVSAFSVTEQVSPSHPPPVQPAKKEPAAAVPGVNETVVPVLYASVQSTPHVI